MSCLDVQHLSLTLDNTLIIDDINFTVGKGEVIGLLGPNGAGKTSLLKMLAGQLLGDGRVLWGGKDIKDFSVQGLAQQIAVVSQINDIVFSLTVEHVVRMGLLPNKTLFSRQTESDTMLIANAIEAVGLTHKFRQVYSRLSGGEQQRALIARALVQQSSLLILDEPVNHLDVFYQHQILQLLHDMAKQLNLTIIMSLHDMNLAAQYCDKLALLNSGKLVAFGHATDVLQSNRLTQVFRIPCHVDMRDTRPNITFKPDREHVLDLRRWQK